MPDWLQLYALLWALRALEHVSWRPAETVLFEGRLPGRFRPLPAHPGPSDIPAGLVLTNPFRFLGRVYRSGSEDAALDVRKASSLLDRLDSVAGRLLRAEAALSVHLFVIIPAIWATVGLARSWPYLAGGLLILHLATVVTLHGALSRMGGGDRWQRLLPFLLSPPAATEAMMGLTKDVLREVHPVAAGAVLCDDAAFRELAIRSLRRAEFPRMLSGEEGGTSAPERDGRVAELRSVITNRLGIAAISLAEPPRRTASALWYCPRCLAEYASFAASCTDCDGVALRAYEAS